MSQAIYQSFLKVPRQSEELNRVHLATGPCLEQSPVVEQGEDILGP